MEPQLNTDPGTTLHAGEQKTSIIEEYAGDHGELPIGGYATMLGLFSGTFVAITTAAKLSNALPERISERDIVLSGVATHQLTRILTRAKVTIPLRAPFTRYEGTGGAGTVKERPRGSGLRQAIGNLLTCPYCAGPWVASALTAGLLFAPRTTRLIATAFSMVTVSDFLHQAYAGARRWSDPPER